MEVKSIGNIVEIELEGINSGVYIIKATKNAKQEFKKLIINK